MSQENVEVVRRPIAVSERSRRRLEQQLVHFPRVIALLAPVGWRLYLSLRPRSRLRGAIARRFFEGCVEALNRGDLEVTFALFHPEVECIWDRRQLVLGFEPVYHGREARLVAQRQWAAQWAEWRLQPDELIDFGDGRHLLVGRFEAIGVSSGAVVESECAFLFTTSRGRVVREQVFFDRAEALAAAGLGE